MSIMFLSANSKVDREKRKTTTGKRSLFYLRYCQLSFLSIILLSSLLVPAIPVLADDSDWKPPSSVDQSEYISNPESAYLSDNNYAVALGENASVTYANFGLSIPANATIHGIEVRVEVRACSPVCNSSVTIALSSNNGANFTSGYSITDIEFVDSFITLGGDSDTWGNTWVGDNLNDTNFKVRLEANAGVDAVFIDVLQVKVYYTPAIVEPSFTVNASVTGGNGRVNPAIQTVGYNGTARIDISPDSGYFIASITDNGNSVDRTSPYILNNVKSDHSIVVRFAPGGFLEGNRGGTVITGGPEVNRNPCPLTLTVDMMGEIKTATMTLSGVLCQECLATSREKEHQFYLEEGTIVSSSEQTIPKYIRVQEATDSLPTPADGVILSSVFNVNAFPDEQSANPVPIVLEPAARLSLTYNQDNLPENASEVHIAYYNTSGDWSQIGGIAGPAEIGTARGEVDHFTNFAVIARTIPGGNSDFVITNLLITPDKVRQNEAVIISASIANNGRAISEYFARLIINGNVAESQIHNLSPQESKQISFVITGDTLGIHQVKIGNLTGQFEVIVEQAPKTDWIIWVIIVVVIFCIWRFRKTWIRALRQLLG